MHASDLVLIADDRPRITLITHIYRFLLGRNPDPSGLRSYVHALRDGQEPTDVIRAVLAADEFQSRERWGQYSQILSVFKRRASVFPKDEQLSRLANDIAVFCTHQADANPVDVMPLLGRRDFHDP